MAEGDDDPPSLPGSTDAPAASEGGSDVAKLTPRSVVVDGLDEDEQEGSEEDSEEEDEQPADNDAVGCRPALLPPTLVTALECQCHSAALSGLCTPRRHTHATRLYVLLSPLWPVSSLRATALLFPSCTTVSLLAVEPLEGRHITGVGFGAVHRLPVPVLRSDAHVQVRPRFRSRAALPFSRAAMYSFRSPAGPCVARAAPTRLTLLAARAPLRQQAR